MWLEIITIRVQALDQAQLVETLLDNQRRILEESNFRPRLFTRQPQSLDIAVHLRHPKDSPGGMSTLGLRLAQALRDFGTVDHGLWNTLDPNTFV